jgi:hypothetical protein
MRFVIATLALTTACATATRPVRQLDDREVMVGGSIAAPGYAILPDLSAYVRYAPIRRFDVTVGAGVLAYAPTALLELRGHVPIGETTSLVLHSSGEVRIPVGRARTEQRIGLRALTSPAIAWQTNDVTVYTGPSLGFVQGYGDETARHTSLTYPAFTKDAEGALVFGGLVGAESKTGFGTWGGALQANLIREVGNPSARFHPSFGLTGYFGF